MLTIINSAHAAVSKGMAELINILKITALHQINNKTTSLSYVLRHFASNTTAPVVMCWWKEFKAFSHTMSCWTSTHSIFISKYKNDFLSSTKDCPTLNSFSTWILAFGLLFLAVEVKVTVVVNFVKQHVNNYREPWVIKHTICC